jgi:MSHA biogenesis protein MshL
VVVSPQSGLIIIRGYPSELRMAENYLSSAELIMQRQVILEAKIIEVELKDGYQQGINWADLSNSGNTLAGQTGGGTLLQDGVSSIAGNTGNLDPGNFSQLAGNAVSAFGGMFTLAVKSGNFAAFFEFLQTQGNMQVLSSPRVSTVNNQKAVIKVGSDEFFVTDVSSTTTSGVATTTTPNVTLTPFFSGISLDVTPQIDDKGKIILHIHPTISNVVDQEKTIAVGADVLSLPLAFSQVRESDSIVSARNGEIVIIGGLMTEKLVEKEAGTPILSSIPLLGNLFKHTSQEKVKSELVILLKPIVIDNQNSWSKAIGESSTRVKQIYHEYNQ